MRRQEFEISSIKSAANHVFGSRVHGDVKGGDIDLYVQPSDKNNLSEKVAFLVQL